MFHSLLALLPILGLTAALPADVSTLEARADAYNPPRNQIYVQTFRNTTGGQFSMLPLVQNPTQLTHLYLAALHVNSNPGDITLNDNSINDTVWNPMWSEAAQLQQSGVKVMMMIGGAAAGSYPRLCSGPRSTVINESYYQPLYWSLKAHNIDGINLDIEERVAYTCPLALLQRFNKDFGPNFIQTMAPVASELQPSGYGLGGFSYKTLDKYATASNKPNGKLVNWFNVQFYNGWGDASTPNGYVSIVKNGYAASRVALGVLDSPSDGGSGWFNVTKYQATIKSLRTSYGSSFGGVVGWEYWDAGIKDGLAWPYQWVQPMGASAFGVAKRSEMLNVEERAAGDPVSYGPAPWPNLMSKLVGKGALHIAAVRALNISDGDLVGAARILGVPLPS